MTIPNLLSIIRIILVPVFGYTYLVRQDQLLSLLVLFLSGVTDMADGYIARRFHQESYLGMILDPLADKLTQAVAGVAIAVRFPQMIMVMVMFFIKETCSLLGGAYIMHIGRKIGHSVLIGKISTFLLYGTMGLLLLWPGIPVWLVWGLCAACTVCLALAFATYFKKFLEICKDK